MLPKNRLYLIAIILGFFIILTSVWQLTVIPNFDRYMVIHHGFPLKWLKLRYFCSYGIRLWGVLVGIGLILRYKWVKPASILLAFILIFSAYWRHPYEVFLIYTEPIYIRSGITSMSLQTFTWISVFIRYTMDILFALLLLFVARYSLLANNDPNKTSNETKD